MHFTLRLLFFCSVIALALPSCVSKKKFDELLSEKGAIAESLAESQAKIQMLEEKIAQLESDMAAQKKDFEGQIAGMQSDLSAAKTDAANARKAAEAKEAELASLKKDIQSAFAIPGDMTVTDQNGDLVVTLASPVNYKSGSTRINKDAREAIDNLAETLKNNPNMHILVEGHTDDDQLIGGASYKDNWDLSVARAMKVVKRLVKAGVDPAQLSVAGKGEFDPIGDNETDDGQAKNRRTDVKPSAKSGNLYKLGGGN
ncbi:MAG: OmpA family protein [Bacteroidetes bacterium]|jgi:chemotaxis protein MotB|nr:OmpA family protein [Bacteroidota bacterium]MDF1864955.1 OmpA family protein [Saprospiraceae bacterium]